jgi:hypothetical protein
MGKLRVGDVLARAFSLWGRNFVVFFVVSAVVQLPSLWVAYKMTSDETASAVRNHTLLLLALRSLLPLLATGTIVYAVFANLRGQQASLGKSVSVGFSRLFSLVIVLILLALIFIGMVIFLSLLNMLVVLIFASISATLARIMVIAVFVVPLLAVYARFYVAMPVAVVEREGAGRALVRSAALSEGNRFAVFMVFFVLFLLGAGVSYVERKVMGGTSTTFALVDWLSTVALGALGTVATAVTYYELRTMREGIGLDELAAVFD